ncbi:MAG: hypothetical protein R6V19_01030 [Armatimonadota bacterium]
MLLCIVFVVVALAVPAVAQYHNKVRSHTTIGVTPRALGMGDAFVAVADDEQALYWNPAGLSRHRGVRWSILGGAGRVENVDVIDDLASAGDIIGDDPGDFLSADDFDFLRRVAEDSEGMPLELQLGFLSAFSWDNIALGVYGQAAADIEFPQVNTNRVDVDAQIAGQGSGAVAGGWDLNDELAVGVSLKSMTYAEDLVDKTFRPDAPITARVDESDDDTATSADVGIRLTPEERVAFGAVVRNVNSPEFDLDLKGDIGKVTRKVDPSVHFGLAVVNEARNTTIAADIHNVFDANDTGATVHMGVERELGSHLTARAGYGDRQFTWGLTAELGPLVLEMASASDWNDMFGASATLDF